MYRIVISGYYGFANAGDEAMLSSILTSLRERETDLEITVLSGNPSVTTEKYGVYGVGRFDFIKIFQELHKSDLLISGGGSLLQDVTSLRSLFYYLFIIMMGSIIGKKVMLYSHGIGPIRNSFARMATKFICNNMTDLITVRDSESLNTLVTMGVEKKKIFLAADSVLSLPKVDKAMGRSILERSGVNVDRPILGISVRKWNGDAACFKVIAEELEKFCNKHDVQIVLLPLQHKQDYDSCLHIKGLLNHQDVFLLSENYTTEEFLSVIGNFKLLLGMRLHALVFAAVMGVPVLAVSYDPKVDAFVDTVGGVLVGSVEKINRSKLTEELKTAWFNTPSVQNEHMEKLRKKALLSVEKAFDLLHK